MATAVIRAEYAADAADFRAECIENGEQISIGVYGEDVARPWSDDDVFSSAGDAHVLPSDWQEDFSTDVLVTDLFFFLDDEVDLAGNTHMLWRFQYYRVVHKKAFDPDGILIYTEIQVRK